MTGNPETSGIYPLSTVPAEGYHTDPATRSGKVILSHINGKYLQLNDSPEGYTFTTEQAGATQFDGHAEASLAAAKLIAAARSVKARQVASDIDSHDAH